MLAQVVRGAAAGAAATVAMTAVMQVRQLQGSLGTHPQKKIVQSALDASGDTDRPEPLDNALTSVAHLGFGAALGVLYAVGGRRLLRLLPPTSAGAAYALAAWAASYAGLLPRLGLMPPPEQDRPGRQSSLVLGHLVFGAVLGKIVDR